MSFWYQPHIKDITVNGDDLDIYVDSDDFGAIYVTLKIKDVKEVLARKVKKPKEKKKTIK